MCPAIEVVKQHHLTLDRREHGKSRLELPAKLRARRRSFGVVRAWRSRVLERFRSSHSRAGHEIPRVIANDDAQPLRESVGLTTLIESSRSSNECIMAGILRIGAIPGVREGDGKRRPVVPAHERVERLGVAGAGSRDQLDVASLDRRSRVMREAAREGHAVYRRTGKGPRMLVTLPASRLPACPSSRQGATTTTLLVVIVTVPKPDVTTLREIVIKHIGRRCGCRENAEPDRSRRLACRHAKSRLIELNQRRIRRRHSELGVRRRRA